MQGVTGACTCSVCPTQPSRATVPPDTQQEVLSGLLNGELAPDGFGTLTRRGEYIDKKYRPGRLSGCRAWASQNLWDRAKCTATACELAFSVLRLFAFVGGGSTP